MAPALKKPLRMESELPEVDKRGARDKNITGH